MSKKEYWEVKGMIRNKNHVVKFLRKVIMEGVIYHIITGWVSTKG